MSNDDKRRFFEMAACAILMGNGTMSAEKPRSIVNRIHEIWDEIEAQVPAPKGLYGEDGTK